MSRAKPQERAESARTPSFSLQNPTGCRTRLLCSAAAGLLLLIAALRPASAADFTAGDVHVSWDSQVIGGLGLRTDSPSCSLVGGTSRDTGCAGGGNIAQWGNGALGDLNYKSGQLYTGYIKVTSELLLSFPDDYKFMARGTGLYDEAALHTAETPLSSDAKTRVAPNFLLLDLWASKSYTIDDKSGHIRIGNQVLNWGESYFAAGGINAINSLDLQKLLTPGVQLKEAVLAAPMISIAQGLTPGLNFEGYYQLGWNHSLFPAVGTFWSTANQLGKGALPIYVNSSNVNLNSFPGDPTAAVVQLGPDRHPRSMGEYGASLHYQLSFTPLVLGLYFENYHDKTPVLGYDSTNGTAYFRYLENRSLYGLSANLPIGNVALGGEISYRPRDAVSLTGCFAGNGGLLDGNTSNYSGSCQQWKDTRKIQADVVGQLNMQPSDYPVLKKFGANFAVLTVEGTLVSYPDVRDNGIVVSTQGGQNVIQGYAAGYFPWLSGTSNANGQQILASKGTANSGGVTVDYNWTYDGTVIHGWQVTPGVTFFGALFGNTPNFNAQYEDGFRSLNFYVLFNQNPSVWQAGVNFSKFFGGGPLTQPYGDRSNIGAFLTRNF